MKMKKSIVVASYILLFLIANYQPNAHSTPEEDFNKGYGFYIKKDYKQAAYWYQKSAKQGNAKSQYYLGAMYQVGRGVLKDYKQAFHWFQKSAKQGNATSQYFLGGMYDHGRGVLKDYKQAVHWYQKSAEQGVVNAQLNLGTMYIEGAGVLKDMKQAKKWIKKAYDNNQPDASKIWEEYELWKY